MPERISLSLSLSLSLSFRFFPSPSSSSSCSCPTSISLLKNEMEPADIDWKSIVSRYEPDEIYELIKAPKWLDLSAQDTAVDDVAWFCRADCHHPKTFEDFNRWTPNLKMKLMNSNSETVRLRDANLKRRAGIVNFIPSPSQPKSYSKKFLEDLENQDPNMETNAPRTKKKEEIKSSAEKKEVEAEEEGKVQRKMLQPQRRLKSTLSARNLFSGKDVLSQISEFCHELKKLATGKREAPNREVDTRKKILEEQKQEVSSCNTLVVKENALNAIKTNEEENQEASCRNNVVREKDVNSTKKNGTLTKKCGLTVRVKSNEGNSKILGEVRAFPPTPQRFPSPSSGRPLRSVKASVNVVSSPLCMLPKSKTPELDQRGKEKRELGPKNEECNRASIASEAEGTSVDVLWFLKPCTYLIK
ncbi:hypothetical protein AXF42_Ash004390 [Apostasia shenzhenica]|uniref:Uncharacterized protein n=1 Tax=Apostasia shenzhenica TaxID=1088818 RepID=A0A2I0A2S5_9ASPA|nr:hypothetical protein AXF42_Ash004390 [Apostasia shenzhenica]